MLKPTVQIKLLDPRATVPERGTSQSAGYDLIACIDKPISIRAGGKATLIPTGLAMFIGSGDIAGIILPRSGLGHAQGLVLGNTLGLVDGDYQNQWFVSAWNRGQQDEVVINPGDRIAQAIFVPVLHPEFLTAEEFDLVTKRGQGGFGSTGGFKAGEIAIMAAGLGTGKSMLDHIAPRGWFEHAQKHAVQTARTIADANLVPPMGSLGEIIDQEEEHRVC